MPAAGFALLFRRAFDRMRCRGHVRPGSLDVDGRGLGGDRISLAVRIQPKAGDRTIEAIAAVGLRLGLQGVRRWIQPIGIPCCANGGRGSGDVLLAGLDACIAIGAGLGESVPARRAFSVSEAERTGTFLSARYWPSSALSGPSSIS